MAKEDERKKSGEKEQAERRYPIKEPVELLLPDKKSLICVPWGIDGDPQYTPVRDQAHRVMLVTDGLTATRLQLGSGRYEVNVTVQGKREMETKTQGYIVHGNGDAYEYTEKPESVPATRTPITEVEDGQFDIFDEQTAFPFLLSDQIYTITMGATSYRLQRDGNGHAVLIKPDGNWEYFSTPNGIEVRTFGRREDCNYTLNDDTASRNHARIVRVGNVFAIKDTSTNGTHIDIRTPQAQPQRGKWSRLRWGR